MDVVVLNLCVLTLTLLHPQHRSSKHHPHFLHFQPPLLPHPHLLPQHLRLFVEHRLFLWIRNPWKVPFDHRRRPSPYHLQSVQQRCFLLWSCKRTWYVKSTMNTNYAPRSPIKSIFCLVSMSRRNRFTGKMSFNPLFSPFKQRNRS